MQTEAMILIGAVSAMALSGFGSAAGCGVACTAAVGAWKKSYLQNKPALFQLVVFGGAPMTQTFYGFILQIFLLGKMKAFAAENLVSNKQALAAAAPALMIIGIVAGLAIGMGAYAQGRAAAASCDALTETGKGFANYLVAVGIIETVTIFVMVFAIMLVKQIGV